MQTITVIGSLNMDLVVRTPRFPGAGETISGYDFYTIPGGKGANQAVAIARQEVHVHMVGCVGEDEFGERTLAAFAEERIDTRHVRTAADVTTGVAVIAVEDSGENRIILAPGANHELSTEDVDLARTAIADSDAIVMQLEIPIAVVIHAAKVAKEHHVPVILNAAPASSLPDELVSAIDYLIINETEAALLSLSAASQPQEAAHKLRSRGFRNVIVTLGEDGALFDCQQHQELMPGYQVAAVDTTAAGDAFVGAFAAALISGKGAKEAVRWGNAAGALATTVLGAQPSLPTMGSVEDFLAHQSPDREGGGGPLQR